MREERGRRSSQGSALSASLPDDEQARLKSLRRHDILDTPPEPEFDDFTALASQICKTPIALISLVDQDRLWFKSRVGLNVAGTPREGAFCAHAILQPADALVVRDAQADPRFSHNSLVAGDPHVRFYAGAPIVTPDGHALGTLCVMDREPRGLAAGQLAALRTLSRLFVDRLTLRRHRREQADPLESDVGDRDEKSLLDREKQFRRVVEHIHDALIIDDVAGAVTFANDQFLTLFGLEREQLSGLVLEDYVAPEWREQLRDRHERRVRGEPVATHFEYEGLRQDGERRWLEVDVVPLLDDAGRVTGTQSAIRDITERKQAERRIQEREEQYRQLVQSVNEIIYSGLIDPGSSQMTSRLTFVSIQAENILGIAPEEFLANPAIWFNSVHPDDVAPLSEETEKALAAGATCTRIYRFFNPRAGEYRWLEDTFVPRRDGDDRVVGFFGTARDITERKQAGQALRLQGAALSAAANAIVITDRAGVIEWVNPAFTRLTGYTADEAIGQNPRLLKSGKHDPAFYRSLWETILSGRTWRGETTNRRKDGSCFSEAQTITPLLDESGAITHFVAIKEDITERLQLQAQFLQIQKMESVGQLAGGIAHDFNNVLTVINGTAQMALMQLRGSDPLHGKFTEIRRAGERAAALTRQLLAFSRNQILQPVILNLNAVVADVEKMLRRLIGENIELTIVLAKDLANVRVDPGQIEQVIVNLAVNARDAMPRGGTLTIETRNVEIDAAHAARLPSVLPGRYVMLAVSDTGVGMDEATRGRIFEPFFTTKDPGKGTGLGLSTVYGIVKQSSGSVWVYSEVGKGSAFKVYLPRVEGAAPRSQPARTATVARGTETILVVEDEEAVRRLAEEILVSAGYAVLTAANGGEALLLLERHSEPVQLILTDVVMPGMSGPELVERLGKIHPQMKVLYTSGFPANVIAHHGTLDEGTHFLGKPYGITDLTRKVREVLDS